MANISKQKTGNSTSKIGEQSKETTANLNRLKNKIEKDFIKFKQDQKKFNLKFKDDNKNTIKEISSLKKEAETFRKETQKVLEKLSTFAGTSPKEIREELVSGVRMLGERVSAAISEMDKRINDFSQQISKKIEEITDKNTESQKEKDEPFGSLKEGELFDADDFEIVPKDALKKLTLLFKHQSKAVKNFIDKHEKRMLGLEKKLEVYDEENTRLFELLNRRILRNFRFSLFVIIVLLMIIVILKII